MAVTLDDLVGMRNLTAMWRGVETVEWCGENQDVQCVLLRFDGLVYRFIEDPNDGYRSMLREVVVLSEATVLPPGTAVFEMVVECRKRPNGEYGTNDVHYAVNEQTGLVVLEIGTTNTDDYYPSFVFSWTPAGYTPDWLEPIDPDPPQEIVHSNRSMAVSTPKRVGTGYRGSRKQNTVGAPRRKRTRR